MGNATEITLIYINIIPKYIYILNTTPYKKQNLAHSICTENDVYHFHFPKYDLKKINKRVCSFSAEESQTQKS